MKRFLSITSFVFLFSLPIFAQTPTSTASKSDDDVVKISTNLIQVDVTVTDKKGNPLRDLKPADFEIYENGEKQQITNLSFVSNQKLIQSDNQNTAPNRIRPEQVRRTIALVADDLSLSFESVNYVRKSLKKFVDEQMRDGDLVAIIRTGSGIGALQQFTTDKRQLYAAIEKIQWNPRGTGQIGAFAPIETEDSNMVKHDLNPNASADVELEESTNQRGRSNTDLYNYQKNLFATGTLGALDYIIRGMRELPGRKSVMLMSDGFKLFTKQTRGTLDSTTILDSLKRLTDLANRSSVVIYTLDARGLQSGTFTAQDNTGTNTPGFNAIMEDTKVRRSISLNRSGDRIGELNDTQEGLIYLANQTGGIQFLNNNDLNAGIRAMLADQSYYLIAYEPDAETFDPKKRQYNELKIKVNRKDAQVRYRSGFFGVSDEKIAVQSANLTPRQLLSAALSSPFTTNSIALNLSTIFGNDRKSGSFVRSLVHIDVKNLKFTDNQDGSKKTVFDVLAASFGDNGVLIDQISTTYTLDVKKEVFDKFLEEGFIYYFAYPVKKPGVYQYRVAVIDNNSKQLGSATQLIEVPNLSDERLTLSGVMLENLTPSQLQNRADNKPDSTKISNPLADTTLRRFKSGTILRYGFEIYNAKLDKTGKPNLSAKIRLLRDGKIVLDGKENPVEIYNQTDFASVPYTGGFSLGNELPVGEYILQIVVTDNSAKEKRNPATQFIQFEIIK